MFQRIVQLIICIVAGGIFAGSPGTVLAKEEIVSFNTATFEQLMAIKEVSMPESVARAIITHREKNGLYKVASDLASVPGMTGELLKELNPVESDDGGDVVYDPDTEPVLVLLKS